MPPSQFVGTDSFTPPLPQAPRDRVLVVEPDELTLWSLASYLQRWYSVETTASISTAETMLRDHPVAALIISNQLSSGGAELVVHAARVVNPEVRVILMVAGDSERPVGALRAACIEKPFQLNELARLLGRDGTD